MRDKAKIEEIKKLRCSKGFFRKADMANMFDQYGIKMSRQTYGNKERGVSKFTVDELMVLAKVFEMGLEDVCHIFYDMD